MNGALILHNRLETFSDFGLRRRDVLNCRLDKVFLPKRVFNVRYTDKLPLVFSMIQLLVVEDFNYRG